VLLDLSAAAVFGRLGDCLFCQTGAAQEVSLSTYQILSLKDAKRAMRAGIEWLSIQNKEIQIPYQRNPRHGH
jgi:hypothetical protein